MEKTSPPRLIYGVFPVRIGKFAQRALKYDFTSYLIHAIWNINWNMNRNVKQNLGGFLLLSELILVLLLALFCFHYSPLLFFIKSTLNQNHTMHFQSCSARTSQKHHRALAEMDQ